MATGVSRNGRTSWALLCMAVLLFISSSPAHAAPPEGSLNAAEASALVKQLSADKFAERVAAQRQLRDYVTRHPDEVPGLITECDPEAQLRLTRLLEETFLANDNPVGDEAEKALEAVRHANEFASTDSGAILTGNTRLREGRARTAIERLGGRLAYSYPNERRSPPTAPQIGVGFGEAIALYSILLSEEWSGTAEDLWHLRRLSHHANVQMYTIRGNHQNLADLMELANDISGLMIVERGASLGVRQSSTATAMVVSEVVANSAAESAGILPGDTIVKVDTHDIPDFLSLVETLKDYSPGQAIKLQVNRSGQIITLPVKLTSWRSMPLTDPMPELFPAKFAGPLGIGRPAPPALPEPLPKNPPPAFELR